MALPILPVISALASFVPGVVSFFAGEKAGKVAETVVSVAQAVTGTDTPDKALEVLKADPAKVLEFQQSMMSHEKAWWEEETKRLQQVNETMRAEITSGDPYVRRMRPTWGYSMCAAFTAQMFAVTYSIIFEPQFTGEIITSLASLSIIWSVGLSVLGIYVWKRSDEKQNSKAAGAGSTAGVGSGLLDAVLKRVR